MRQYGPYLQDAIEREKVRAALRYSQEDQEMLDEMLGKITYNGRRLHYLAELDCFSRTGWGPILASYIHNFSSEEIRSCLIPQIVSDRVSDCDRLVLDLYMHFRNSDEYFSEPGECSPAGIYIRYDNAFRILKPKRLKKELLQLAYNPHDAHRLPFTMRLLASWKMPEMRDVLMNYANGNNITPETCGVLGNDQTQIPLDLTQQFFEVMKRDLTFKAIYGLKYYPSEETERIILSFMDNPDVDIRASAQKTLKSLAKQKKD